MSPRVCYATSDSHCLTLSNPRLLYSILLSLFSNSHYFYNSVAFALPWPSCNITRCIRPFFLVSWVPLLQLLRALPTELPILKAPTQIPHLDFLSLQPPKIQTIFQRYAQYPTISHVPRQLEVGLTLLRVFGNVSLVLVLFLRLAS